jgi:hypothetical protein
MILASVVGFLLDLLILFSSTGPRPSELYGKFTWRIDNFSQINKRELRSNSFDVGGFKWYGLHMSIKLIIYLLLASGFLICPLDVIRLFVFGDARIAASRKEGKWSP